MNPPPNSAPDSDNFRVVDLFSPDDRFDCFGTETSPLAGAPVSAPDVLPASFLFTNPLFEPVPAPGHTVRD